MDHRFLRDLSQLVRLAGKGGITVGVCELQKAFRQPERDTALGNAIMDLCCLPSEKETFERWCRAQEIEAVHDPRSPWDYILVHRARSA